MAKSVSKSESSIFASLQKPAQLKAQETATPESKPETKFHEDPPEKPEHEESMSRETKELKASDNEGDITASITEKKELPKKTPNKSKAPVIMPDFGKRGKERKTVQHSITLRPSQEMKAAEYLAAYEINFNEFIGRLIDSLPDINE